MGPDDPQARGGVAKPGQPGVRGDDCRSEGAAAGCVQGGRALRRRSPGERARRAALGGRGRRTRHQVAARVPRRAGGQEESRLDRKSTRLNSSHVEISYAVFCLKKKKKRTRTD